jgi:hypothetical protein
MMTVAEVPSYCIVIGASWRHHQFVCLEYLPDLVVSIGPRNADCPMLGEGGHLVWPIILPHHSAMDETSPQLLIRDIRSAMEDISLPTKLHDEESANKIITAYLTEGVEEFRELNRLRKEVSTSKCTRDFCGGRLPQALGVEQSERRHFFARQRAAANAPGVKGANKFYTMTQNIGKEL